MAGTPKTVRNQPRTNPKQMAPKNQGTPSTPVAKSPVNNGRASAKERC